MITLYIKLLEISKELNDGHFHRDEKEPLKDTSDDAIKRNSSVEFDGRRVYATSGGPIIGKNSAV